MIPANGWQAVYVKEDASDAGYQCASDKLTIVPLVCFALMEEQEDSQIVGMVPDGNTVIPCVSPTFLGYLAKDARLDSMLEPLNAWLVVQAEEDQRRALAAEIQSEQAKSGSEKPPELRPIDRWN